MCVKPGGRFSHPVLPCGQIPTVLMWRKPLDFGGWVGWLEQIIANFSNPTPLLRHLAVGVPQFPPMFTTTRRVPHEAASQFLGVPLTAEYTFLP